MKPFFCIKFCICHDCLSFNPWSKYFLQVIQATSLVIFEYYSVDNSQASCACCYCDFPVWLSLKLSLGALTVSNTWPANLEMCRVKCYTLIHSAFAASLNKPEIIALRNQSTCP